MPKKTVRIVNKRGLHARAAAKFVRLVEKHGAHDVTVSKDGNEVPGMSIMGLLMLGAGMDSEIEISASVPGVLAELVDLVESRFEESE